MDFSSLQDQARANTWKLLLLFALAILTFLAALNTLPYFWAYSIEPIGVADYIATLATTPPWFKWHKIITVSTCFIIGLGMVGHMNLLASGGPAVARSLGATEITSDTTNPHFKRFHNIVAEMAIASGVPMPSTYVMRYEFNINAFAAGFSLSDSVVCVTQGCLEYLTRDELQGVVAHEFSHIFNGDMRLNMRLSGFLSGLMFVSFIGEMAIRSVSYRGRTRYRSYGRSDARQGELLLLAVGAFLWMAGYLGYLLGKLIQSSISREREYLADASAVQFTRNPSGIGGALKKIGGLSSKLINPKAGQFDHMYICSGVQSLFDSHPPIEDRIKRILPHFDGQFERPEKIVKVEPADKDSHHKSPHSNPPAMPPIDREFLAVGFPTAIALALTLTPEQRQQQIQAVQQHIDKAQIDYLEKLSNRSIDFSQRFQVLTLLAPSLRQMSKSDLARLKKAVAESVKMNQKSTIFDFTLYYLVRKQLDRTLKPADFIPKPTLQLRHCQYETAQLLKTLAYAGHKIDTERQAAFQSGCTILFGHNLKYTQKPLKKWRDYLKVIDKLTRLSAKDRTKLFQALETTAKHDKKITILEVQHLQALNLIFNFE